MKWHWEYLCVSWRWMQIITSSAVDLAPEIIIILAGVSSIIAVAIRCQTMWAWHSFWTGSLLQGSAYVMPSSLCLLLNILMHRGDLALCPYCGDWQESIIPLCRPFLCQNQHCSLIIPVVYSVMVSISKIAKPSIFCLWYWKTSGYENLIMTHMELRAGIIFFSEKAHSYRIFISMHHHIHIKQVSPPNALKILFLDLQWHIYPLFCHCCTITSL